VCQQQNLNGKSGLLLSIRIKKAGIIMIKSKESLSPTSFTGLSGSRTQSRKRFKAITVVTDIVQTIPKTIIVGLSKAFSRVALRKLFMGSFAVYIRQRIIKRQIKKAKHTLELKFFNFLIFFRKNAF